MKKDLKQQAQSLGLRTNQTQKTIGDKPKTYKPPKVYIQSEVITKLKLDRNIVLLNLYPELNELINHDGTLK